MQNNRLNVNFTDNINGKAGDDFFDVHFPLRRGDHLVEIVAQLVHTLVHHGVHAAQFSRRKGRTGDGANSLPLLIWWSI